MERITGLSVLEEMERLRASRIEEGLVPVWLPAEDVEWYSKRGHMIGDRFTRFYDACREALEGGL